MKSISKYLLLFALPTLFVGCEKDNEVTPDDINHSVVQTSFGTQAAVMQVNSEMSFVDFSRGVVTREWTLPEGVATDLDGNPVTTSDSDNLKVRFVQFGEFYVDIKQEFGGDVYVDTEFTGKNTFEKSLLVTVLDSVRASYTAVNSATNEALTLADDAKNEIKAGSFARFSVTSTGKPATNKFTVYNDLGVVAEVEAAADAESEEIFADIQFPMPGVYNIKLASSNNFGYSEKVYNNVVEIVASQEPISLNSIKRATTEPGNVIALTFSRAMVKQEPFDIGAFTLAVTNGLKTPDITVTEVNIEANVVNLVLSDMIYSSDIIYLNYDSARAPLAAIDNPEIRQESLVSAPVTFDVVDMLPAVGYDTGFEGSTNNWLYLWWGAQWGKFASELSTAQAHSGSQSYKIEMSNRAGFGQWQCTDANTNSGAVIANKVETFPVVAGNTYVVGVWTYIESIDPNEASAKDLIFSINEDCTYDNQMPFTSPVGEWVYRTQQIPVAKYTGDATFFLRGNNADNATPFIIYIDDISLSVAEPRP